MTIAMPEGHKENTGQGPGTPAQQGVPVGPQQPQQEDNTGVPPQSGSPVPPKDPVANMAATSLTVVEETEETAVDSDEFPHDALAKLDEMISRPRWVVPVLPKGELEILLEAAIRFAKKGTDEESEPCRRFYNEGLTASFNKIFQDEAVSGWKLEIHKCILDNAKRLVQLCVIKLKDDNMALLDLLAMVLNANSKFHAYNGHRGSENTACANQGNNVATTSETGAQATEEPMFAKPLDARAPKGWLVDLVNYFGSLGGFEIVLDRFVNQQSTLNVFNIAALVKPFGLCYEVLLPATVEKYFLPIIDTVPVFLDKLTDEELKKGSKSEVKNDALSSVVKALKQLASRLPERDETIKALEMFRLKMILRLLQISSFNGKMNALNEVNKVITNVSYYPHRHSQGEEDEWLTAEKMAEWIRDNSVLATVLRDSLHQPQYVEKLEKIIRFMIKEKALTPQDLDLIWTAQAGKHEAIVKNVHDLLAKLAWDFSPEQLDHLFTAFQESWANASKKQREKLLELIRRLAEDDKEGIMANKVLGLLWNLAHSEDVPTDIMDQALTAHIKILDYSASQDREAQKMQWINRFVEELKNEKWVLPALKQIREICQLFSEAPQNCSGAQRASHIYYRTTVINELQRQHSIVMLVAQNLNAYMMQMKEYARVHPDEDPTQILPDGLFNHVQQVQERLRFLRFLLKDGQLWLCEPQAKQIWVCLAVNATYPCDRENGFKWFAKLMGEEPDLDPEILKDFMVQNILQLDPSLLTENGMMCFERFFRNVNVRENKLIVKRRGGNMMDDQDLIGLDYIWRVVLYAPEEVADKAILLIKELFTNLGPRLTPSIRLIHDDFIQVCVDRLKAAYDTISKLDLEKEEERVQQETGRMVRVLTVLREYVTECDNGYCDERALLPLSRACRGKHMVLVVRFPNQSRQPEDLDVWTHQNDTLSSLKRQVLHRLKANNANVKLDLYYNTELLESADDRKLLPELGIKDKNLLTAKFSQTASNMPSSPDSSSDSSPGGSPHHAYDGPNLEAESCLPGVLMSRCATIAQFLFQIYDLGSSLQNPRLRDCARSLLTLMPIDVATVERLASLCYEHCTSSGVVSPVKVAPKLEEEFFAKSPAQVLYALEAMYAMLMPAGNPTSDTAFAHQTEFMRSGLVSISLDMLTKNNFMASADPPTKRSAYLTVLKIAKLSLTASAYAQVHVVAEMLRADSKNLTNQMHNHAVLLQNALVSIPNPHTEYMTRTVAQKLGPTLSQQITLPLPDLNTVRAIMKMAWSASSGSLHLTHATYEDIHAQYEKLTADTTEKEMAREDVLVCREALEFLTMCVVLHPAALESLNKDKHWQNFIIDILLLCKSRSIRVTATDQFLNIATKCSQTQRPLLFFITLLFTVLPSKAKEQASQSHEYFQLLCRLLNYACAIQVQYGAADTMLQKEIVWLKHARDTCMKGGAEIEDALLEGHLGITKELLQFQSPDKKYEIGSKEGGCQLIKELIEDFIFPSSKMVLQWRQSGGGEVPRQPAVAVCSTPLTLVAAFDLLVALATGSTHNLRALAERLTQMYYSEGEIALTEWEYLPPIGPRPSGGFVGLKNGGATCYMNSLLQQLFMIDEVRSTLLSSEGAADENMDDYDAEEKQEQESGIEGTGTDEEPKIRSGQSNRSGKEYHISILKHVQVIFAHLACSQLQYYVPRAFWKDFRLNGELVNLREQHDALEFFTCLVDSLDEALKALNYKPVFTRVMGGSFADQKICKDCPHRYSREESFMTLSIDIRNQHNLLESLEQYVKGDLLEGANAYHCERCNKKVDTVKRMCIKKLPPMLGIQLKRFDYDWERECAIKFNDYFEFPRELDMEPYTVQGVAKLEGEQITDEREEIEEKPTATQCTKYRLVGVAVHSGQASGGHYYSYILHRPGGGEGRWYKFDDGEVTQCKMHEDEEMKNQCFGGEYMGEMYDHMTKRMAYRKQKRWWNAYILMYERLDSEETHQCQLSKSLHTLTIDKRTSQLQMPASVERCVRRQNIQFLHNKNQFSLEYFQFMTKLLKANAPYVQLPPGSGDKLSLQAEELAMTSVKLASSFLFNVCFHTKKNLRGSANEWYDALSIYLRNSKSVRHWFALNVLFKYPARYSEYLLECPSTEVRSAFMKILVFVAHFSKADAFLLPDSFTPVDGAEPGISLSDHLLLAVLNLRRREVSEHGRHLTQYFHLFLMYANLGTYEKQQLLRLGVPAMFMQVALDEGPGPPIKYQYAELGKLYGVVSLLVRCCDISDSCASSQQGQAALANPHGDPNIQTPLQLLPADVNEILFVRTSYVKKLLEDCNNSEDTCKLLKFCSWENPHFSSTVLSELLWQVAYSYTYELRPFLDLLLQMLLLEDSWQSHRIHNALKGIPDDRDGLFDTIQRSKSHYQKRAYQCIKMMVSLFSCCARAVQMLQSTADLRKKWAFAVDWLQEELERRQYGSNAQYAYNNWSPPAQSNETSNGYFLERSHSARITLAKAMQLVPEEVLAEGELGADESTSPASMDEASSDQMGQAGDSFQGDEQMEGVSIEDISPAIDGQLNQSMRSEDDTERRPVQNVNRSEGDEVPPTTPPTQQPVSTPPPPLNTMQILILEQFTNRSEDDPERRPVQNVNLSEVDEAPPTTPPTQQPVSTPPSAPKPAPPTQRLATGSEGADEETGEKGSQGTEDPVAEPQETGTETQGDENNTV